MEIYLMCVSDLMEKVGEKEVYDLLPGFRRKAADSCKNLKDRERSLAAGALLVFCMKKRGVSLEETPCYNENGKMYFPQVDRFYINLSHGGDYAACVSDSKEVGIDVEKIRQYRENVARRIGLEKEMQSLSALKKEEEKNSAFTRLWTRKESAAKLSGEGIAGLFDAQAEDCIYTKTYMPFSDCYLSVSSRENNFPDEVILLSPESLVQ